MLNDLWKKCIEGLTGTWDTLKLSPALAFWGGGFLIWGITNHWKPQTLICIMTWDANAKAKAIFFIVSWLLGLVVSTRLIDLMTFRLLRWCEGYDWTFPILGKEIDFFETLLLKQKRLEAIEIERTIESAYWEILYKKFTDRAQSRDDKERLYENEKDKFNTLDEKRFNYPVRLPFMPTILGNILRAAEEYPLLFYGLDIFITLPRLLLVLPPNIKKEIDDSRERLNACIRLVVWGALFSLWPFVFIQSLSPWWAVFIKSLNSGWKIFLTILLCIIFLIINIITIRKIRSKYLSHLNQLSTNSKQLVEEYEEYKKQQQKGINLELDSIIKNFDTASIALDKFKKITYRESLCGILLILLSFFLLDILVGTVIFISFVVILFAYSGLLVAAKAYGDVLRATFDTYRFHLYEALRWPPPTSPQYEPEEGWELTKYLFRHSRRERPHFLAAEKYYDIRIMEAELEETLPTSQHLNPSSKKESKDSNQPEQNPLDSSDS